MKKILTTLCLSLTLLLGSIGVSESADFQKGLTAAQSGDYATALREWTPLAKQGNAGAQFSLGFMYEKGGLKLWNQTHQLILSGLHSIIKNVDRRKLTLP
jgi:TPR repeat protein